MPERKGLGIQAGSPGPCRCLPDPHEDIPVLSRPAVVKTAAEGGAVLTGRGGRHFCHLSFPSTRDTGLWPAKWDPASSLSSVVSAPGI